MHRIQKELLLLCGLVIATLLAGVFTRWAWLQYQKERSQLNALIADQTLTTPLPSARPEPTTSNTPWQVRLVSLEKVKTYNATEIQQAVQHYTSYSHLPPTATNVDKFALRFEIETEEHNMVPMYASVFIPQTTRTEVPWFVFGSGTSGMEEQCAPSLEKVNVTNIGNYENQMVAHASQSYVVIFPDYEGFHDAQRWQSYFIAEMEARTLLGATRALYEAQQQALVPGLKVGDIFLSGYSQGGHAALSAASRRSILPPELSVKGVVAYASATDIIALLKETPRLSPYVVFSFYNYYNRPFALRDVFQDKWLGDLEQKLAKVCIDQTGVAWSNSPTGMYTAEFASALSKASLPEVAPGLVDVVENNMIFENLDSMPVFLIQGSTDPIVTAFTQRKNRQRFCEAGVPILYREYLDANHFQTRQVGFDASVEWMNSLAAGENVPSNCGVN